MHEDMINNFESISEDDWTKYAGEWIAVIDKKIVIHSKNFKEVREFTKKNYPNKRPLLSKVPENMYLALSA